MSTPGRRNRAGSGQTRVAEPITRPPIRAHLIPAPFGRVLQARAASPGPPVLLHLRLLIIPCRTPKSVRHADRSRADQIPARLAAIWTFFLPAPPVVSSYHPHWSVNVAN